MLFESGSPLKGLFLFRRSSLKACSSLQGHCFYQGPFFFSRGSFKGALLSRCPCCGSKASWAEGFYSGATALAEECNPRSLGFVEIMRGCFQVVMCCFMLLQIRASYT